MRIPLNSPAQIHPNTSRAISMGLVLPDPSCDPPAAHGIFVFVIGNTAHPIPPARNLFGIKS